MGVALSFNVYDKTLKEKYEDVEEFWGGDIDVPGIENLHSVFFTRRYTLIHHIRDLILKDRPGTDVAPLGLDCSEVGFLITKDMFDDFYNKFKDSDFDCSSDSESIARYRKKLKELYEFVDFDKHVLYATT